MLGTLRRGADDEVVGSDVNPDRPYAVHLAVLDLSDRGIRTIIPLGTSPREGLPERGDEFRPVWSPDGRQLVCRNVEGALLLVRLDASTTTTLARGDLEEPWPVRVS